VGKTGRTTALKSLKLTLQKPSNFNEKYLKGKKVLTRPLPRVYDAFLGVTEGIFVQVPHSLLANETSPHKLYENNNFHTEFWVRAGFCYENSGYF